MRTQQEIEQAFAEGGSVLIHNHNGGLPITRQSDMPSAFDLAAGNPDQQAAVIARMEADLAAQQAELEALKAGQGKSETEPDVNAELKAKLDKLTRDELLAEVKAEGITLPADVSTKAEIVSFLLNAQG